MAVVVKRKSITLIEMIVVIVVLSLAIPVLFGVFRQANLNVIDSETIATSGFYAEELLEEIRLKRFDEHESPPWSNTLGPDNATTGIDGSTLEDSSDHKNWDDVDDYNGFSDNPATGYIRSVTVEYMELNANTWQPASSVPTDYKRVTVSVSRSDGIGIPVSLVFLAGGY